MDNILKKESILYGLGHILARLISFLLLPLFTNILSPHEYGIVALIYAFIGFFTVVLHMGLDTALLRYYKPANNEDKIKFTTNTYIPMLTVNIIFCIIGILTYQTLGIYIIGDASSILVIMILGILFCDVLWSIPMIMLRADNHPIHFIVFNLINVVSNLVFIYYFVIYHSSGLIGIILSNLLSSILLVIITFHIIWNKLSLLQLNYKVFKQLASFGVPFVFAGIFSMIIELSDRYIIKYMLGFEQLGIYNAGYKLGMLMLLIVMGFNMAWQPFFLDKKNKKNKTLIISISNTMFLVFSVLASGIIILAEPISKIEVFSFQLIGPEFQNSLQIIPWICIGYLFHGAYLLQLPGPYLTNNTSMIATIRGSGATINIMLNFLLIPKFGIQGAAIATCLSFFIMAIFIFIYNKKIYPINYNKYKMLLALIIIGMSCWIVAKNPSTPIRLFIVTSMICVMGAFINSNIGKLQLRANESIRE